MTRRNDFKIDIGSGLVAGTTWVSSPNCDARPAGVEADLIVVHGISLPPGEFGGDGILQLFTNTLPTAGHPFYAGLQGLKVSSHFLIRRDGAVVQFVPIQQRAWHAGVSFYRGRERCNDFSVGIELEGTDECAYEPAQYVALAQLVTALCRTYASLSTEHLVGHSDIAPGRKTDPGPFFDWVRFGALLRFFNAAPIER
jgi:AmpD protein